jgi:hypothetical protein
MGTPQANSRGSGFGSATVGQRDTPRAIPTDFISPRTNKVSPTEPFIGMAGGGGGMGAFHFGAWVFPLPPDGPLEIFVALPAAGMDEASVTLDGAAVRAAAQLAHVIWT